MSQDLLNLIQRPAVIDQEAGKSMSQIVNPQLRQIRFPTNAIPHLADSRIGLACLLINEHILEITLRCHRPQYIQRRIIQRHRTDALGFGVTG